ncbi:hypothetical protein M069_5763 [Bacteroides fragilis str. B1 (UDC16-1)]|nr:hypothetical protein M069_5763 [Bacteroides fragilis str. B1 (UDC16-1)]
MEKKTPLQFEVFQFLLLPLFYTSDNESNSQQSAEIETVAKSLPHFCSFFRISYV